MAPGGSGPPTQNVNLDEERQRTVPRDSGEISTSKSTEGMTDLERHVRMIQHRKIAGKQFLDEMNEKQVKS